MTNASPSWLRTRMCKLHNWEQAGSKRLIAAYLACYTLAFAALALVSLSAWFLFGQSLIWQADGLRQYLPYFIYEGEWLRNLFGGLISGQGWNPELWSSSMGYGSDVLATLDVFWNPLNALSAFASPENAEYLFQFIIVLRFWLAGLAFSWYALYRGNGRFATLCGALLYSLCGTALIATIWPAGADGLILLPLLLVGAEKVLDGKRPSTFIAAVALFFIISYYFAYAACILLIPYCIVRFVVGRHAGGKKVTLQALLPVLGKFLLFGCIGVMVSAVAIMPGIIALMGTERATTAIAEIPLLYSAHFYQVVVAGWLGTSQVGSDCSIGFGSIAFLCCVALFLQGKHELPLKTAFIILTAFMLLPFFGSMFNGFNYATNRWIWAYALCVCYIVVRAIPLLQSASKRTCIALAASAIAYCVVVIAMPAAHTKVMIAALIILVLTTGAVVAASQCRLVVQRNLLAVALSIGLVGTGYMFANPFDGGWATHAVMQGKGWQELTEGCVNSAVAKVDDSAWWRYDAAPADGNGTGGAWARPDNDSVVLGLRGIDFYYSIYNNDIDRYHTQLGIAYDHVNFRYYNLGGRSMLETLNNVKYYANPLNDVDTPAYGYDDPSKIVATEPLRGSTVAVYEGKNTLPLGYTYSNVISESDYLGLTPLQRQEALMQGVVLDDESASASTLPKANLDLTSRTMPYTIADTDGLTVNDDETITVEKPLASLTMQFSGLESCETYLYVTNLNCTPQEEYDPNESASTSYSLYAKANNGSDNRTIVNYLPTYHMYGGKTDWALNLGYADAAQTSVSLSFSTPGTYSFSNLQIVCQPMEKVSAQTDALKESVLQNLTTGANSISGTISLNQPKYLYFSIPYSKGWTATVNGQAVTIEQANTAFMAIALDEGDYNIQLQYVTPGLVEGACVSLMGIAGWISIAIFYRKRASNRQPQ